MREVFSRAGSSRLDRIEFASFEHESGMNTNSEGFRLARLLHENLPWPVYEGLVVGLVRLSEDCAGDRGGIEAEYLGEARKQLLLAWDVDEFDGASRTKAEPFPPMGHMKD